MAVPDQSSGAKTGCSVWGLTEHLSEDIVAKLRYRGYEALQGGAFLPKEGAWYLLDTVGGQCRWIWVSMERMRSGEQAENRLVGLGRSLDFTHSEMGYGKNLPVFLCVTSSLRVIHVYAQLHPCDSMSWGVLWPWKPTSSNLGAGWMCWGVRPFPDPHSSLLLITEQKGYINIPALYSVGRITRECSALSLRIPSEIGSIAHAGHCS